MSTASPTEILVAGKSYEVLYVPLDNGDFGECDSRLQVIKVDPSVHADQMRDALLHELYHAVDHEAHTKMSEGQVRRHSTLMLDVLRSNPALVAYLISKEPNGKSSKQTARRAKNRR